MRKMATDSDGDRYVAERSVGDATVKVLPDTIQKERQDDGTVIWLTATYEVAGPDGEVGGIIVRNANSSYDVPEKAQRPGSSPGRQPRQRPAAAAAAPGAARELGAAAR
jgi:hypothetical protein